MLLISSPKSCRSYCAGAIFAVALLDTSAAPAAAQCTPEWLPGEGVPSVDGTVYATIIWDPDGAGPQPPVLVAGGSFTVAGGVVANNIVSWNGSSWLPLGTGMDFPVRSLAVLPDGVLVAAGSYLADPFECGVEIHIARWNGSTWTSLGAGYGNGCDSSTALAVLPDGDLVAGGAFETMGGVPTNYVARWNGSIWAPLGAGMNGGISALAVLPDGDLVAGGYFTVAGGVAANRIARWNGSTWAPLGAGMDSSVHSLAVLPNGDLVAGGSFYTVGGVSANSIARWNGSSWAPLGTGIGGSYPYVNALAVLPNGDLAAGGYFTTAGGLSANNVARWNGSTWAPLGTGMSGSGYPFVYALAVLPDGGLVAGGEFTIAGGVNASYIASWNGATWAPLGTGMNFYVTALAMLPDGGLVAGGEFTIAGGVANTTHIVARRNGSTWVPLDTVGMNGGISVLAVLNGDLVAGGHFTSAGGAPNTSGIARWNGSTWAPLGTGMGGSYPYVYALAMLSSNGDLVAGGDFTSAGGAPNTSGIARWNGSTWAPLGTGMGGSYRSYVSALAVLPNGDLAAGGYFTTAGGLSANNVARWNGSTWAPLGTGIYESVDALAVLPSGDLVAGTEAQLLNGEYPVARWNGTTWAPLGTGYWWGPCGQDQCYASVSALAVLPNGDLVAGGLFYSPGGNIARWNGSTWAPLGTGGMNGGVGALAAFPNGGLAAGGSFTIAGGQVSAYFARWGCPACLADFNHSGAVDSQDFFDFLTAFFAAAPSADFNHDGLINSEDLFDFLAAFFAGCP